MDVNCLFLKGQEIRKIVDDPTFETTYGNVTKRVITTTSARAPGKSYTTTLDYLYANHTTPWCLGLPTQVKVTRAASGATTKIRTTNNTFNSSNCRLLTSTNASQSSTALQLKTTLTYDSYGNLKTATQDSADGAAADRKTEFFYDSNGHLPTSQKWYIDSLTNPEVSKTWDYELIQPLSTTDTQGQTTSWTYDDFARVKSETRPDGTSSTWAYTACIDCWHTGRGRFYVQRDDSDGLAVRDHRDWYGRSIGGWNHLPTGTKSQNKTNYDALGRIVRRYLPWVAGESNYYATYSYDLIGRMTQENRPISETLSSGAITSYTYQGLTQTVTNPESQVTTTKLDPLGRIIKVTDDDNGETEYQYTVFDALYKTWDPADNLTTINYNNRGDKTSMSEPNMGSWSYAYNVFGELTSQTDAKSQNITFSYNQLGLRTNRVDPEGTTSWGYYTTSDAKLWLPSSADSPGFEEDYSYDTLSRPSSTTTTIDSVAYTTNYSYHSSGSGKGKLNRITYPTSTPSYRLKIDHVYDAWGHLNQVKNSSGTVYYELDETDALGRERESTLGNDLVEKRVYDAANLTLTSVETGPGTTATIQDLYYEWDKLGNLTRREDLDQSVYETFTYDDLNRLKSASRNGTSTLTVSYNNLGNITSKSDVGSYTYGAGSAGPHAVTSITGTRPGTYSYDANGNLSSRAGDSITWYSYNKPKKINDGSDYAEFKYGPDRARFKQVAKTGSTTTTTYYVGPHFEKETAGSTTQYRHNIFAGGQMIAVYMRPTSGSITTQYVHRDHQSNVVAVTDTGGSIDQEFSFDAFGARRNTDWTADHTEFDTAHDTERGYTGHEHIDNVRLIHMNGRVQDPILGRMISADPFVPNPFNTQAFNRYSYVYNSPLSLVDPSGFCPADLNVPCTSNAGPGIGILDRISSPGHDEGGDIALENALADLGNKNPELAPYVSAALGYPTNPNTSTESPAETLGDGDGSATRVAHPTVTVADQGMERTWGSYLPGTKAGERAAEYWANIAVNSDHPLAKLAHVPGVFAALWTDDTAAETAFVLCYCGCRESAEGRNGASTPMV